MRSIGYHEVIEVLEGKITIGASGDAPNETNWRDQRSLRFSRRWSTRAASELLGPTAFIQPRSSSLNQTQQPGA